MLNMKKTRHVIFLGAIACLFSMNQAFGKVLSLNTSKDGYSLHEKIIFKGVEADGEQNISVLLLEPHGVVQTIVQTTSNKEGIFEFQIAASDYFDLEGTYKINAHILDQPVPEGKAVLFTYSELNINVITSTSLRDHSSHRALPPNCQEIISEGKRAVFCEDEEIKKEQLEPK